VAHHPTVSGDGSLQRLFEVTVALMLQLPSNYGIVIRPTRGWFHLNLADLWRYRDLLFLLVHRDFVARYKQTILGPTWFVLQPLLTTIVFSIIFSGIAKIPTDGVPAILFYLAGLLGWNYFAQTFQSASGTLVSNADLFGKVYFPRLIVPLSAVISNLFAVALQLATLLAVWIYFKLFTNAHGLFGFSVTIVWLPLVLLQVAALSLGVGLWLTALTVKYRDFAFLGGFIIQIWLYATPVIYPLSQIPEKWRWIAVLNPMTMPVETIKVMFLSKGTSSTAYLALSVGLTILALLSGVMIFNKVEKTFIDTV
jgi:lipopolysaccharide transport system permease protein